MEVPVDDSGDVLGVICKGCLTEDEEEAIVEDMATTGMEVQFLPDYEEEKRGELRFLLPWER